MAGDLDHEGVRQYTLTVQAIEDRGDRPTTPDTVSCCNLLLSRGDYLWVQFCDSKVLIQ